MQEPAGPLFIPKRVIFTPQALAYPLGARLWETFSARGIPVFKAAGQAAGRLIPGTTPAEVYREAKRTLVVGVRRISRFETCRPSADFQLPLVSSCPGLCRYCYLHTRFGRHPYLRVYANTEEILERAGRCVAERLPAVTSFEASAAGDPLPTEPYTGALKKAVEYFADLDGGRLRFVTKYTGVKGLLFARHGGRTRVRFSVNTEEVIRRWEGGTPSLKKRLEAAEAVAKAGYPAGFMIAPVFLLPGWQKAYGALLDRLAAAWRGWGVPEEIPAGGGEKEPSLTFEVVSHRFTGRAREAITEIFPGTDLPLAKEGRSFRFGQFGYGKYVYSPELIGEMKEFFRAEIARKFPFARLEYAV
ncbi:MAG: spore photoproduct lyase [Desulfotomaculales bacterium]